MKKTNKNVNIVITFLLICTILITMLSAFVRFSLTNKDIYLTLLENTNTYAAITDVLYKKMNSILGDDISEDLKKSIITEEDVKKEADVVLDCMISNIINGQANVPEIDTDIYKERVTEALNSLTGYDAYINRKKDLTSSRFIGEYTIEPMNLSINNSSKAKNNYLNVENSKSINDDLFIESLATRAEIEAQGRAMLKEKGMTEAQARAKLAEKGISEEQAWQYLIDNGYLDEEQQTSTDTDKVPDTDINSDNENYSDSENNISTSDNSQEITSQSEGVDDTKISKKKIQNIVMSIILDNDMGFEEKMDKIYSELMNESEIIINKEMDNLNFSKLISSNIFNYAVKTTSILYKSFYINLSVVILLIILLAIINSFNLINVIDYWSKSMLISGILSVSIFGFIYLSKAYVHFNGIMNKSYFQDIFLSASEYFCRILFISSAGIFIVGLIMNIFVIKKRLTRR